MYKNAKMMTNSKIKILETCTMSVLMYEAQTLSFTQLNIFRTTQTTTEKSILNIKRSGEIQMKK